MFMRFRGGGVGHKTTHEATTRFTQDRDIRDIQSRSNDIHKHGADWNQKAVVTAQDRDDYDLEEPQPEDESDHDELEQELEDEWEREYEDESDWVSGNDSDDCFAEL